MKVIYKKVEKSSRVQALTEQIKKHFKKRNNEKEINTGRKSGNPTREKGVE